MSKRHLPEISALLALQGDLNKAQWDIPSSALQNWTPLAAADAPDTISIFEPIGAQWDGTGVTAKRVAGALRSIGNKDVVVSINSPGGDFFEGVAIYNLLREHPANVTVKVPGIAASAASIIAMAGDTVSIGKSAFLMIHNSWSVVIGNRNDLLDAADLLSKFDAVMASVYADRTGMDKRKVAKLMDSEAWLTGQEAVDQGFADSLLSADHNTQAAADNPTAKALNARRQIESALAKQGVPRAVREALMSQVASPRDATGDEVPAAPRDASGELLEAVRALNKTLSSHIGA